MDGRRAPHRRRAGIAAGDHVHDRPCDPRWRVTVEDVQRRIDEARTLLVDARGPERFEGKSETIDKVAGHIPGARNHFYKWNLGDDGTMLPPADAAGAAMTRCSTVARRGTSVMYCGSGVTACHNLLAMEHAGLTGSAALRRLVVRMVERPDAPDRNRTGHVDQRLTTND